MTATHKTKERERRHEAAVSFFTSTDSRAQISTTTATSAFVPAYAYGLQDTWLRPGGGTVMFVAPTVTIANALIGVGSTAPPEQVYEPELVREILRLAKEPPAAVFDSDDDLMGWLDDLDK